MKQKEAKEEEKKEEEEENFVKCEKSVKKV